MVAGKLYFVDACIEDIDFASPAHEHACSGLTAFDLAADVADDDPAQTAAQDSQLTLVPIELFGMSVAWHRLWYRT